MRITTGALLLLVCSLIVGCATTPPTPETPIALPVSFPDVWFRPTLDKPGFQVMTDTGTVVVGTNGVSFSGKSGAVEVDYKSMREVSFGKVGSDLINSWVTIKYLQGNAESYALFSGGKVLGWGGFGVASDIFQAIDSALHQRGMSSIVKRT